MTSRSILSQLPNLLTGARIALVVPIAWLLVQDRFGEALFLFFVAGVSDGLDGWLAKHYGWTSRLGSILDPLADKLLLVTCFVLLALHGYIPLWLLWAVLARDLVIVLGGVAYHYLVGKFAMEPSPLSKLNTFVQIAMVLAVLFDQSIWHFGPGVIAGLVWLTLFTTLASGTDYVWTWSGRAWQVKHRTGSGTGSGSGRGAGEGKP